MIAYKLFRQRKDGSLGSLFINRRCVLPLKCPLSAQFHPTKGFAQRLGWHCVPKPEADHLAKDGRVWARIEIPDTRYSLHSWRDQTWILAEVIIIKEVLSDRQVKELLST